MSNTSRTALFLRAGLRTVPLAVCLATLAILAIRPPGAAAEELRIGAWNIEQLGSPDYRSQPARGVAQQPADLAAHLLLARVDLLALEEIGDTDGRDTTRTNATIDETLRIMNQTGGQDWTYRLLPKKDLSQTYQLTGVAWNRRKVVLVGEPWRIPVRDDPDDQLDPWQRHPHALKFSAGEGRTDFVLIPVHMKSNVGGAVTVEQRALEARALIEQLPAIRRHFGDQDLVILGDFNCLSGDEPAMEAYRGAGFDDRNSSDTPTTWRGGQFEPAPFDRILFPRGQPEFDSGGFQVLAPGDEAAHLDHKKRLSDHLLVATTLRVMADDDDDGGPQPGERPLESAGVDQRSGFRSTAWAQNAAEHGLACRQAYRWATVQLLAGLQDPFWTADVEQMRAGDFAARPPAVILDLDETLLDNSPYQARLLLDNQPYSDDTFLAWVNERQARALPGAAEFLEFAASKQVRAFFISNRPDSVKEATIANLNALGIPASADNVLTRNDAEGRGKDKVSRRAAVARTHRIVLLIGDNLGDFCAGVDTTNQTQRNAAALAAERTLGSRWVVIPNTMYGGWTAPIDALPDRAQTLDPAQQSAARPARVRIVRLVPNPVGADDEAESVTIQNQAAMAVELAGWLLKDDDGEDQFWTLSGRLAPGQELTVVRPGSGMQLGNSGDTVRLVAPGGQVVHEITYDGPVEPGAVVRP
ncbi:MAG: lamin tail domain-containing protein [Pirellulaceae bacterium]|nr:lamin tail domain-containing protein [Pirellulaceae bacterium]